MRYWCFILFLLGCAIGFAQQKPDISVRLDTSHIRIGEQFHYTIVAPINEQVTTFPAGEDLGLKAFTVLKTYPVDTLKNRLIKKYLITGFDSGHYHIPNQEVVIGERLFFTDSIPIQVSTVEVDTINKKVFPIKPIAQEPIVFDDYKPYFQTSFWIIVGVVLLVLLGYLAYKKYRAHKNKTAVKVILPPFEEAMERLSLLDKAGNKQDLKSYYIELSEIIRVYLYRSTGIAALEATTTELLALFNAYIKKNELTIESVIFEKFEPFLHQSDFVKFAKWIPMEHEVISDRKYAEAIICEVKTVLSILEARQKEALEAKKESTSEQGEHQPNNQEKEDDQIG